MPKERIIVDTAKCTGCRICELICSFGNYGEFNPKRSRVRVVKMERILLDVPILCRLCRNPPCVSHCPENALNRAENGVIELAEQLCTGCEQCVEACPFGAISIDPETGMPLVCHMCHGDPLCVKWCPTDALRSGDSNLVAQRKRWDTAFLSSTSLLRKWNIPLQAYEHYYGKG